MPRILAAAILAILSSVTAGVADAEKIYTVRDEPGGSVIDHWVKYAEVNKAYDRVVIDGRCKSSCTMLLGIVPLDKICITPRGYFMFHAAHNSDRSFNARETGTMMNVYAPPVRDWVIQHHALDQVDPYTYLYSRDVRFIQHCRSGRAERDNES
jgi:hypothetical protein